MKTRSNTTGNSNKQVLNVLLRTAAVMVSVVILSFTVNAQNLLKELLSYDSYGKMTLVLVDESNNEATTENAGAANFEAFSVEEETEAPLNVESWMTNSTYFNSTRVFTEVDAEESLEIESWMVDGGFYTNRYAPEAEAGLELEAWMTNSNYFNSTRVFTEVDSEELLEIESWMVDEDFYTNRYAPETETALTLEAWMTDSNYFNSTRVFAQVDVEELLEVESWMVDGDFYTGRYVPEAEANQELEAWMCDSEFFNY